MLTFLPHHRTYIVHPYKHNSPPLDLINKISPFNHPDLHTTCPPQNRSTLRATPYPTSTYPKVHPNLQKIPPPTHLINSKSLNAPPISPDTSQIYENCPNVLPLLCLLKQLNERAARFQNYPTSPRHCA